MIQNKERNALYATLAKLHDEELFTNRQIPMNIHYIALMQVRFLLEKSRVYRRQINCDINPEPESYIDYSAANVLMIIDKRNREMN